jgi:hypothetical protein
MSDTTLKTSATITLTSDDQAALLEALLSTAANAFDEAKKASNTDADGDAEFCKEFAERLEKIRKQIGNLSAKAPLNVLLVLQAREVKQ